MKLWLDVSARLLALLWAGFWIYFFVAESLASPPPLPVILLFTGVGIVFALLAFIPWRWEKAGGILLIGCGLLLGTAYSIWAPAHLRAGVRAITAATFGVPPLLAGALFLAHRRAVLHHVHRHRLT